MGKGHGGQREQVIGFCFDCGIESKGSADDKECGLTLEAVESFSEGRRTEGLPFFSEDEALGGSAFVEVFAEALPFAVHAAVGYAQCFKFTVAFESLLVVLSQLGDGGVFQFADAEEGEVKHGL